MSSASRMLSASACSLVLAGSISLIWNSPALATQAVLFRINCGGPLIVAGDGGPDWSEDQTAGNPGGTASSGTPSPLVNHVATGDRTYGTITAIDMTDLSIPTGTPAVLFQSERWDPPADAEMEWDIPTGPGTYEVRLYFGDIFTGTQAENLRIFSVAIEGGLVMIDYDQFADVGGFKAVMKSFFVSSDGILDIDFFHNIENPAIKAIEILSEEVVQTQLETWGNIKSLYH